MSINQKVSLLALSVLFKFVILKIRKNFLIFEEKGIFVDFLTRLACQNKNYNKK